MFPIIKTSFSHTGLLYRNFLHWSFSKISIEIFGLLISLGTVLPVAFLSIIFFYIFGIDGIGYIGLFMGSAHIGKESIVDIKFLFFIIIAFINFLIFIIGWTYAKLKYFELNLDYISGEKKHYFTRYDFVSLAAVGTMFTHFFHEGVHFLLISLASIYLVIRSAFIAYKERKELILYYKTSSLALLYLLIPVVFFLISMLILILLGGGVNATGVQFTNGNDFISILSFLLFIVSALGFIYITYRLYFSFVLLADTRKKGELKQGAKSYIKESFGMTKGWKRPLQLFVILLIFGLLLAPIKMLQSGVENTYKNIISYTEYRTLPEESKQKLVTKNGIFHYTNLELKYGNISTYDLQKNIKLYGNIQKFLSIFVFILIGGLMEMVMVSYYTQIITKK
ncbi:MAG: hypothetical protein GY828_00865 [Candidatus Gracilibacteria bacterium]|nr:hypothetical protein [Candidatus Gracilibacteria bacterium]